jgi:hypothetical protein
VRGRPGDAEVAAPPSAVVEALAVEGVALGETPVELVEA